MAYDVTIGLAANGWIAKVGCQVFVFTDPDVLIKELREYLLDPQAKQDEVLKSAKNIKWTYGLSTTAMPPPNPPPQMYVGGAATMAYNPNPGIDNSGLRFADVPVAASSIR